MPRLGMPCVLIIAAASKRAQRFPSLGGGLDGEALSHMDRSTL